MTDQEDSKNLSKIVFGNNNQATKSWSCFKQTCSRSLIVILSQLFVILFYNFGCFWGNLFSKTCDESTVWVGILCSASGYISSSPRLRTSQFLQKIASSYHWLVRPRREIHNLFTIGSKLESFKQILMKFTFLSTLSAALQCYAKKD